MVESAVTHEHYLTSALSGVFLGLEASLQKNAQLPPKNYIVIITVYK